LPEELLLNADHQKDFLTFYKIYFTKYKVWYSNIGDGEKAKNITNIGEVISYYNPTKIIVTTQKNIVSSNELFNTIGGYNAVHNQWYSINQAYNLMVNYEKENNMTFDFIIKTRYDLEYLNVFDKKELGNKECFWVIPTFHSQVCKIYTDMLFFTGREKFEKIINFKNVIDNYLQSAIDKHNIIEGEQPLTEYIRDNKLDSIMNYSKLRCNLIRLNGERIGLYGEN